MRTRGGGDARSPQKQGPEANSENPAKISRTGKVGISVDQPIDNRSAALPKHQLHHRWCIPRRPSLEEYIIPTPFFPPGQHSDPGISAISATSYFRIDILSVIPHSNPPCCF